MKRSRQDRLLVELDGATVLLRGRTAQNVPDVTQITGSKWLLSDFQDAPPRFMAVEAPVRYAEMLLARRLQEMGEAEQGARILTHWKQRRGETSSELFFTTVSGRTFRTYEDRSFDDEHTHLIFSCNALLAAVATAYWARHTVAVLFEHDRHLDYLIGRSGKILAAGRLSSYAIEAKESLAESLRLELRNLRESQQVTVERVVYFNWLRLQEEEHFGASATNLGSFGKGETTGTSWGHTSHAETGSSWLTAGDKTNMSDQKAYLASEWVRNLTGELEAECIIPRPIRFEMEGSSFLSTALPTLTRHLDVSYASSPTRERLQYMAMRIAPLAAVAVWLVLAGLFWGGIALDSRASLLEREIMDTSGGTAQPKEPKPLPAGMQEVLNYAGLLNDVREDIELRQIISDLSLSGQGRIRLDKVEVRYDDRVRPLITITGLIQAGFEQAQMVHKDFLEKLQSQGYGIQESRFGTDVQKLDFTITLNRKPT